MTTVQDVAKRKRSHLYAYAALKAPMVNSNTCSHPSPLWAISKQSSRNKMEFPRYGSTEDGVYSTSMSSWVSSPDYTSKSLEEWCVHGEAEMIRSLLFIGHLAQAIRESLIWEILIQKTRWRAAGTCYERLSSGCMDTQLPVHPYILIYKADWQLDEFHSRGCLTHKD